MKNYFEEMRKRFFSKPLHLFDWNKCYSGIVISSYYQQKIQSIKDVADIENFCERYNCVYHLISIKNDIGMIAIIRQRSMNYMFADFIVQLIEDKSHVFKTPICVN